MRYTEVVAGRSAWIGVAARCLLATALAACDGENKTAVQEEDVPEVNEFFPQRLQDSVDAIAEALGGQSAAGAAKVAVIANRHSNYWTAAQIGTARAAAVIGCYSTFDATSDGLSASQVGIVERKVTEGFVGISIAPLDADGIVPAIAESSHSSVDHDGNPETSERPVNVITFDTDAAPGSPRALYLGTENYEAGKTAGKKMLELLGSAGGKVAVLGGRGAASNAQERVRGVADAFKGSKVELAFQAYDDIDFDNDVPRQIVVDALAAHSDLAGIIGIYAYNGPIAIGVLEDQRKTGSVKLVAFDLDAQTITGLKAGKVHAAIGQRPYWMGYLSVYILYAMSALGVEETMELLAPWLDGEKGDLFDSGHDVVTPENIDEYEAYLTSLGLSNS